jgi:hypothetical protein
MVTFSVGSRRGVEQLLPDLLQPSLNQPPWAAPSRATRGGPAPGPRPRGTRPSAGAKYSNRYSNALRTTANRTGRRRTP